MADILVAEDYPSTRSALRMLLKSAGHTVRFAVNGEEALAQVAQKRPDLLLLDVMMPKKNGYNVLSEIRRTDAHRIEHHGVGGRACKRTCFTAAGRRW